MPRYSKEEVQESLAVLRKLCPPGTEVVCILRSVSRSGTLRRISFFAVRKGDIEPLTFHIARALDYASVNHPEWALKVGGCGMDMGFAVVYDLSCALHGTKDRGADAALFKPRRGHYRAGYSLTHRWV